MSVKLLDLASYCDELLEIGSFEDYCPNGLQVQAGSEVVDSDLRLILADGRELEMDERTWDASP